jgi:hypothetical protein
VLAYFRVEGTSRVSWSLLVEAASADEATAIARRMAGSQSELRREYALQTVDHQVGRLLALGEPTNGGSPRSPREREAADSGPPRD